jgi:hypothetical protein
MTEVTHPTYQAVRAKPQDPTPPMAQVLPPGSYMGPGRVVSVHGAGVDVHLSQDAAHVVTARLALAQPYAPTTGDELLVIGNANGFYAIGVLMGHGLTELTFQGDVRLRAKGELELCGDAGLKLSSPNVTIAAGELKTFARAVTEKVDTAYTWVKQRLTFRAGEVRRRIEGADTTRAKNSTTLAEEVVKIDAGGSVQLGH